MNYSRQRESILNFLDENRIHPTAETVYQNIKKEYPKISLGTVYRNLTLLADNGIILRIPVQGEPDRFDYIAKAHPHFICNNCGSVLDLEMDQDFSYENDTFKGFKGLVTGHDLKFFGICPDCMD